MNFNMKKNIWKDKQPIYSVISKKNACTIKGPVHLKFKHTGYYPKMWVIYNHIWELNVLCAANKWIFMGSVLYRLPPSHSLALLLFFLNETFTNILLNICEAFQNNFISLQNWYLNQLDKIIKDMCIYICMYWKSPSKSFATLFSPKYLLVSLYILFIILSLLIHAVYSSSSLLCLLEQCWIECKRDLIILLIALHYRGHKNNMIM